MILERPKPGERALCAGEKMIHNLCATYENVTLSALEKKDISTLRVWRNDAANTKYLRKLPYITPDMQSNWFESYLQDQTCYTFSIQENQELRRVVGSICLYDVERKKGYAEWGRFMIGDPEAHGKDIGMKALLLCLHIGFDALGMSRIYGSVHENNIAARTVDDKVGFVVTGSHRFDDGMKELEIEMTKERFYQMHLNIKKVTIRTKEVE